MRLEYLTFWFKWKKLIIPAVIVICFAVGYSSTYVVDEKIVSNEVNYYGTVKNIQLPGINDTGCVTDCDKYLLDTQWRTRKSTMSQLSPLVGGARSMYQDSYIHQGFGGALATAEGTLIADLVKKEAMWANISARITSGIGADFNNDGYNEFLFGLASHNPIGWTDDESKRYRRNLEIISPYSEKPEDYRSINGYALPRTFCAYPCAQPDGTPGAAEWAIDGDVTDVAAADFNNDGWVDIAYLGISAGDHSWLGLSGVVNATGLEYTNENGTRFGVSLNSGVANPGQFAWSSKTSALETYIRRIYPFDTSVSYTIKMHKIATVDLDVDGNIDILVTGDKLIVAWGDGSGKFTDIETLADTPGGTDSAIADYNNDGVLDIVVYANSESVYAASTPTSCIPQEACRAKGASAGGESALYLGKGTRKYEATHTLFSSADPTSVTSIDVNGDGWLDIVFTCTLCTGAILETAVVEKGQLVAYSTGVLVERGGVIGLERSQVIDVDLDGDMDILFSGRGSVFRQIWVNPIEPTATTWLKLKVVGSAAITGQTGSATKPLGTVVTITGEFGVRSEIVRAASNYVYFNLGSSSAKTVDSVTVRWSYNKNKDVFTNVPTNTTTVIVESSK